MPAALAGLQSASWPQRLAKFMVFCKSPSGPHGMLDDITLDRVKSFSRMAASPVIQSAMLRAIQISGSRLQL
jgi:hypothetical protein